MARPTRMPTTTPASVPSTATCRPTSIGRTARVRRGTPRAIPMPISRRCDSTMRLIRLNAASAAAARTSPARAFQKSWSLSMSS